MPKDLELGLAASGLDYNLAMGLHCEHELLVA